MELIQTLHIQSGWVFVIAGGKMLRKNSFSQSPPMLLTNGATTKVVDIVVLETPCERYKILGVENPAHPKTSLVVVAFR